MSKQTTLSFAFKKRDVARAAPPAKAPVERVKAGFVSAPASAAAPPPTPMDALAPAHVPRDVATGGKLQEAYCSLVGYDYAGERPLPAATRAVFERAVTLVNIPEDFQVNKVAYGALSGMSFEERVISAYTWRKLPLKPGCAYVELCTTCGREGHESRACPDAF